MKVAVISDLHLSEHFDQDRYDLLYSIICSVDKVIINGDFWDGYICTFDEFVESRWRQIFPELLARQTVYIFGNHDKKEYCDGRIKQFCVQSQEVYEDTIDGCRFVFQHGHKICPSYDCKHLWVEKSRCKIIGWLGLFVEWILSRKCMKYFHRNIMRKSIITCEEYINKSMPKGDRSLILGHNHYLYADDNIRLYNSGLFVFGIAEYLVIDNGKVTLRSEKY